ncbi:hypothetical protein [Methylobacterium nigriterrae]|uniref:hypothetical protein n=1 Tax=Methylobacterium nigriterrae TaxID=3127512 RepID=UPI0030134284
MIGIEQIHHDAGRNRIQLTREAFTARRRIRQNEEAAHRTIEEHGRASAAGVIRQVAPQASG